MLRNVPQSLGDSAFWILTALAPGRRHGYAILLGVAESSADSVQLKPTTLYAVLDRLAGEGLVEADGDETVQGRTRRYYRLTDAGEQRLRSETARLEVRLEAARAGLLRLRLLGAQA